MQIEELFNLHKMKEFSSLIQIYFLTKSKNANLVILLCLTKSRNVWNWADEESVEKISKKKKEQEKVLTIKTISCKTDKKTGKKFI